MHGVELTEEGLIRQHSYRLHPRKVEILRREIEYMLEQSNLTQNIRRETEQVN